MTEDGKFYINLLKSRFAESDYGSAVIDECVKAVNEAPLEDWVYEALKGKKAAEIENILKENKKLNLKALLLIFNGYFHYINNDSDDFKDTVYEVCSFKEFTALLELYTPNQPTKDDYLNELLEIINDDDELEPKYTSLSEVDFEAVDWTDFYDVYDERYNPVSDVIHDLIDKKFYSCLHMLSANIGPTQLFLMLYAMICEEQVQEAIFGSEDDYIQMYSKTDLDEEYFALGAEYRDRCALTVDAIKQNYNRAFNKVVTNSCDNLDDWEFLDGEKGYEVYY